MLGVIISHHGNMSLQTMNHLTLKEKEKKPISAAMYVILMRKSPKMRRR